MNVGVDAEALATNHAISAINAANSDILLSDIRLNGIEIFKVLDQINIDKV